MRTKSHVENHENQIEPPSQIVNANHSYHHNGEIPNPICGSCEIGAFGFESEVR
jgi:hypothetical protein